MREQTDILVTGGTGTLGRVVVAGLREAGPFRPACRQAVLATGVGHSRSGPRWQTVFGLPIPLIRTRRGARLDLQREQATIAASSKCTESGTRESRPQVPRIRRLSFDIASQAGKRSKAGG